MSCFDAFLDLTPRVREYPELQTTGAYKDMSLAGISVLTYDGADYRGQHTKIYAHVGFPETVTGKVPAVVLIHGGGGHPEDAWIKHWNSRGYAAISMDTTGFFPTKPIPHLYEGYAEGMERRLVEPFAEEGYTVGPDNSRMTDGELPLEEQWMYHAVAAVILAHNHPGGIAVPSSDDVALTRHLDEALRLMEIPLLEHYVFAGRKYAPIMSAHRAKSETEYAASSLTELLRARLSAYHKLTEE